MIETLIWKPFVTNFSITWPTHGERLLDEKYIRCVEESLFIATFNVSLKLNKLVSKNLFTILLMVSFAFLLNLLFTTLIRKILWFILILFDTSLHLTYFWSMFPFFIVPENTRKPKVFICFQGIWNAEWPEMRK